jgi:ribosomal protein L21
VTIVADLEHVIVISSQAALNVAEPLAEGMRLPAQVWNEGKHPGVNEEQGRIEVRNEREVGHYTAVTWALCPELKELFSNLT